MPRLVRSSGEKKRPPVCICRRSRVALYGLTHTMSAVSSNTPCPGTLSRACTAPRLPNCKSKSGCQPWKRKRYVAPFPSMSRGSTRCTQRPICSNGVPRVMVAERVAISSTSRVPETGTMLPSRSNGKHAQHHAVIVDITGPLARRCLDVQAARGQGPPLGGGRAIATSSANGSDGAGGCGTGGSGVGAGAAGLVDDARPARPCRTAPEPAEPNTACPQCALGRRATRRRGQARYMSGCPAQYDQRFSRRTVVELSGNHAARRPTRPPPARRKRSCQPRPAGQRLLPQRNRQVAGGAHETRRNRKA